MSENPTISKKLEGPWAFLSPNGHDAPGHEKNRVWLASNRFPNTAQENLQKKYLIQLDSVDDLLQLSRIFLERR